MDRIIAEQNAEIAAWMEVKYHEKVLQWELTAGSFHKSLKYHTSWDWLMPVYRKIKDYLQNMERPSKNHCCKGDMIEVDIHCAVTEINILKAHEHIFNFITWHSQQTK